MEKPNLPCADPGIFSGRKQSGQHFFSPQLILQFTEGDKSILFQGSRGGPTFSRGVGSNFFQGGGGGSKF